MNTKIAIGISTNRRVKPQTMACLLNLINYHDYELEFIVASEGYTIAENRLYIMVQALKRKCSHLLFIDDDMTFEPNVLDRLYAHEKDIVGVVFHSRTLDVKPSIVIDGEVVTEIPKELTKVQHVGTGIMLINLGIVKEIPEPWFYFATFPNGQTLKGEDAWFCERAIEAGFEVWVDPTIKVGHLGDYLY